MAKFSHTGLGDLMDAYLDGDPAAFGAMYRRLRGPLRTFLLRHGTPNDAVDDLLQQTFLKAHRARQRFVFEGEHPDRRVVGWYFAIARNTLADHRRRVAQDRDRSVRIGRAAQGQEATAPMFAPPADPEQRMLSDEQTDAVAARVRAALRSLTPGTRAVVELHKLRGMSMLEVSEHLSLSAGAVRVRAHRGYRALARALGPTAALSSAC